MSYEYTDSKGDKREILGSFERIMIRKTTTASGIALITAVDLLPEDAPAVALAILEAAGVADNKINDPDVLSAWHALNAYQIRREEDAEREAEDPKVGQFYVDQHDTAGIACSPWVDLPENLRQVWRARHRAAREFFTRDETPAPRVLQHGDPEPDLDTKWRDTGGNVWSHGHTCHRDYPVWRFESAAGSSFGRWTHLDSCFFPMTEVTE